MWSGVEGGVRSEGTGEDFIEVRVYGHPQGYFSPRFVHFCGFQDRPLDYQDPPGYFFVMVIAAGLIETDLWK